MTDLLVLINFLATAYLVGLIWIIQVVHYPSFHFIDDSHFKEFAYFHQTRMGFVVGPIMLVEIFSSFFLLVYHYSFLTLGLFGLNILIWLCTFFYSVPCHHKLLEKKDSYQIKKLIITNWPRTIFWNLRLIGILWIYFQLKK